jgi:Holliday junction resolvase RusA-like endonuclease
VHTYTPETTVNWEQTVVWQVKQALAQVQMDSDISCLPFAGRIVADVRINVERPKSLPKSVEFPMKSRPGDVDNLAKSVLDALQLAGIIEDDKTVTDLSAYKRFANSEHPEGVEVELISWID